VPQQWGLYRLMMMMMMTKLRPDSDIAYSLVQISDAYPSILESTFGIPHFTWSHRRVDESSNLRNGDSGMTEKKLMTDIGFSA
jgi:hypothetical protein